ncbi:MAG: U32 family peptidase [Paludibacteraceae bacterium]|nr:U32 family peptidase [Paludibacteraceae bacterium]
MQSKYEIMAPVGSWESLAAAIEAGADSVYFGIEYLNMRARSSANFTTQDLHTIVNRCREAGVKTYLTLNTVMYPEDLSLMRTIVDNAKEAGLDAIIASDIAVMQYANQVGVEVHLSTQLNIANTEALRFYAQFADVVVLARELNMEQVAQIHHDIIEQEIRGRHGNLVRIEMFCHGALCMAVSGKCYLSLNNYNASANRGACVQVCRHAYTVKDKETGHELDIDNQYIMSPKDLKTIHFLNKMLDAGVTVFKIEGRARGAEYVKTVVTCYREAIAAYEAGEFDHPEIAEKLAVWDERMARVFNRGWWDGYYLGQRLGEWTREYGSKATRKKVYVGKVTNYFKQIGVAEFYVEAAAIQQGDEYLVTGETTGAYEDTFTEMRIDMKQSQKCARQNQEMLHQLQNAPADTAVKGCYFSAKTTTVLHRGDKLYKLEITE